MPRPAWHSELRELKLYPMFSWTMNMRLLRLKTPRGTITQLHQSLARRIDEALTIDQSGHTAPYLLHKLMLLLNKTKEADHCLNLARRIKEHNRKPHESHIIPIHKYTQEICYLPPELCAEIQTGHDPEHNSLNTER